MLYRQLTSLAGPLFAKSLSAKASPALSDQFAAPSSSPDAAWGLDPAMFGRHPNGQPIDPASLCVRAPSVIEIRLPADLAAGCEFVTTGLLETATGAEGSVQLQVLTAKPDEGLRFAAGNVAGHAGRGARRKRGTPAYRGRLRRIPPALPGGAVLHEDRAGRRSRHAHAVPSRRRAPRAADARRRADGEARPAVGRAALRQPGRARRWSTPSSSSRSTPRRTPTPRCSSRCASRSSDRAAAFRQRLVDAEPRHVEAVLEFADRAYRRPLSDGEKAELRALYRQAARAGAAARRRGPADAGARARGAGVPVPRGEARAGARAGGR